MRARLDQIIRKILFMPATMAIAVGVTLFTTFFTPGGRLADLETPYRLAINVLNLTLYYSASLIGLGSWLAWGLRRYIPWYPLQVFFYLPLAILTGLMDSYAMNGAWAPTDALWSIITSMSMVIIAVSLGVLMLRPRLDAVLVEIDRPGCLFRSTRPKGTTFERELPIEFRGTVQKLQSANQYIEVTTTKGSGIVRIPLAKAVDMLDRECGLRVSRSNWIAYDFIEKVAQNKGVFEVTGRDGDILKVGVTYSDAVIEQLTLRGFWPPATV